MAGWTRRCVRRERWYGTVVSAVPLVELAAANRWCDYFVVLVATSANSRVQLAHIESDDDKTLNRFADGLIAAETQVVMDGHAGYNMASLGERL